MKVKEILKYVLSAAIAGVLLYFSFRVSQSKCCMLPLGSIVEYFVHSEW